MNSKFKSLLLSVALFSFASVSHGSVTVQISSSGWGNNTTASTNGMPWGFLINSAGASFAGSVVADLAAALEGFSLPSLPAGSATPVQIGTTGLYFARAQSNTSNSGPPTFTDGFMFQGQFDLGAPVGTGDALGLLWFAEGTTANGDHFGFQDLSFGVPSDGNTITAGTITSTPGLASNTIGAAAPIPEPSRAILAGLGLMGLFFRRRR